MRRKTPRPHCSLHPQVDECGWLGLRHGFQSSGALKMPIIPRLRTRLMASAPMVPRKDGIIPWFRSHVLRDVMSAITPSIWKWDPTTALTWKSWWLWPLGRKDDFQLMKQKQSSRVENWMGESDSRTMASLRSRAALNYSQFKVILVCLDWVLMWFEALTKLSRDS